MTICSKDQQEKLSLLEFCKLYTNAELTESQEAMLRNDSKTNPIGSWNWYRRLKDDGQTAEEYWKEIQLQENAFEPIGPGFVGEGILGPDKE